MQEKELLLLDYIRFFCKFRQEKKLKKQNTFSIRFHRSRKWRSICFGNKTKFRSSPAVDKFLILRSLITHFDIHLKHNSPLNLSQMISF